MKAFVLILTLCMGGPTTDCKVTRFGPENQFVCQSKAGIANELAGEKVAECEPVEVQL